MTETAPGVPDPAERAGIKPRPPHDVVLHHEAHAVEDGDEDDLHSYEDRLASYYAEVGRAGGLPERVLARLADAVALTGRDRLRGRLDRLGFRSR